MVEANPSLFSSSMSGAGEKGRDDGRALAGLERVDPGADEGKGFLAAREVRANIEGFEMDGFHGGGGNGRELRRMTL